MKTQEPRTIYLKDYEPAPYLIDETALDIRLHPTETRVTARLAMRPNPLIKAIAPAGAGRRKIEAGECRD